MHLLLLVIVCLTFLFTNTATAMHANDHRLTLVGILYNTEGHPLPEARLELRDPALPDPLAVTTTTAIGAYQIVAHLHDADRGRRLALVHTNQTHSFTVEFDPTDHTHERLQRVDVGTPAPTSPVLMILAGLGAVAVLSIGGLLIRDRRRRASIHAVGVNPAPLTHPGDIA